MRIRLGRAAAGTLAIGLVGLAVAGLEAGAPDEAPDAASAWSEADRDLSRWARGLQDAGHDTRSVVTDAALAADRSDLATLILFLHGGSGNLSRDEAIAMDALVHGGGSVWIADADGRYNSWLHRTGVAVTSERLLDPSKGDPANVSLAYVFGDGRTGTVAATRPATLVVEEEEEGGEWVSWLVAPVQVHLDVNGNGSVDRVDPPGPYVVGAARPLEGGGRLVVTADATMFTNAQLQREGADNLPALLDLVGRLFPQGATVVFDETPFGKSRPESPWSSTVGLGRTVGSVAWAWRIGAVAAGLVLLGLAALFTPKLAPYVPHRAVVPTRIPALRGRQDGDAEDVGPEVGPDHPGTSDEPAGRASAPAKRAAGARNAAMVEAAGLAGPGADGQARPSERFARLGGNGHSVSGGKQT